MGFHLVDIIAVVGIALLLFGPKTLQSISRSAGKGVSQAKGMKDKVLDELHMEDFAKVTDTISRIPMSPQQAARKIITSTIMPDEKKAEKVEGVAAEEPVQEPK